MQYPRSYCTLCIDAANIFELPPLKLLNKSHVNVYIGPSSFNPVLGLLVSRFSLSLYAAPSNITTVLFLKSKKFLS